MENETISNQTSQENVEQLQIFQWDELLMLLCHKLDNSYVPKVNVPSASDPQKKLKDYQNTTIKQAIIEHINNCTLFSNAKTGHIKAPKEFFPDITIEELVSHIDDRLETVKANNTGDPKLYAELMKVLCHYKIYCKESGAIKVEQQYKYIYNTKNNKKLNEIEIQKEVEIIERDFMKRFDVVLKKLLPLFMSESNAEIVRPHFFKEIPEILKRTQDQLPTNEDLMIHVNYIISELVKWSVDLKKPYVEEKEKINSIVQSGQEEIKNDLIILSDDEVNGLFTGIHAGKEEFVLDEQLGELGKDNSKTILQDIYNTYSIHQALYRRKYINHFFETTPDDTKEWDNQTETFQKILRLVSSEYANLVFMMSEYTDPEKGGRTTFERNIDSTITQMNIVLNHLKKMGLHIYIKDQYHSNSRRHKERISQVPIHEMFTLVDQIKKEDSMIFDLKYEFKKILSYEKEYVQSGSLSNLFGYRFDFLKKQV